MLLGGAVPKRNVNTTDASKHRIYNSFPSRFRTNFKSSLLQPLLGDCHSRGQLGPQHPRSLGRRRQHLRRRRTPHQGHQHRLARSHQRKRHSFLQREFRWSLQLEQGRRIPCAQHASEPRRTSCLAQDCAAVGCAEPPAELLLQQHCADSRWSQPPCWLVEGVLKEWLGIG